jgi:acyl-CoA thioesterase FadM
VTQDSTAIRETFHAPYRVRFDEAGPDGTLRTSGLLRYAQDVAWQHSEALGFDRAWYGDRGLTWLVRGVEIGVARPAPMGAQLDVTTAVLGYRKVWARRRSEVLLGDGTLSAWVHTDWLLIDSIGRPTRVPSEISHVLGAPVFATPLARVDISPPPRDALLRRFTVRPQELDPLRHVNNATYLDWMEEAVVQAAAGIGADAPEAVTTPRHMPTNRPRHFQVEYAAAAEPDDELESVTWPEGATWAHIVRRGSVELVRARAGDLRADEFAPVAER